MQRLLPLIFFALASAGFAEEPPPAPTVERIAEILDHARPHLERMTGLELPPALGVEITDRAGMEKVLAEEIRREVAVLHPDRSESSRETLVKILARSFARVVRAKYGLATKRIHVADDALTRLPEGVAPDAALVQIVCHEALHAMDDAAFDLSAVLEKAKGEEAIRALRMVIEGRAEHFGRRAAALLGSGPETAAALVSRRDPGERLVREAGRRYVAALDAAGREAVNGILVTPPLTTTAVFHPERRGKVLAVPDRGPILDAVAPGLKREALCEQLLRKRLLTRLDAAEVDEAFAGFLAATAAVKGDGTRLTLVANGSPKTARGLLGALVHFEGQALEKPGRDASGEIAAPDGRRWSWAAAARGRWVVHLVGPAGEGESLWRAALAAVE